jgi:hypothetical protein
MSNKTYIEGGDFFSFEHSFFVLNFSFLWSKLDCETISCLYESFLSSLPGINQYCCIMKPAPLHYVDNLVISGLLYIHAKNSKLLPSCCCSFPALTISVKVRRTFKSQSNFLFESFFDRFRTAVEIKEKCMFSWIW